MAVNAAKKPEEIDYYGPEVIVYEDVLFGVERLADMEEDIRQLHRDHWNETETLYLNEPLDPDYEYLRNAEECRRLVVFTVRDADGVMVGNCMFFISRNIHMKTKLTATEDTFFLIKSRRGKGLAAAWLEYMKTALASLGITYVVMTDKSPVGGKALDKLFKFSGFREIATTYMLKLGE